MTIHTLPRRRQRHPQQPTVVVQSHLNWLLAQGTTRKTITTHTGVTENTIRRILAGTTNHVRGGVATALLTLRPTTTANGYVPAVGTIRRLRTLVAFGYTTSKIAAATGLAHTEVNRLTHRGQQTQVQADTRARVANLYERLSATPGPSDEARRIGRTRGWAVPAAWDDIDNPQVEPCSPAVLDRRTLINRVYTGHAHIDLLIPSQQVGLWKRWAQDRADAGSSASATQFAIRFGINKRRALRIKAAAGGGTNTIPTPSRTIERTAA